MDFKDKIKLLSEECTDTLTLIALNGLSNKVLGGLSLSDSEINFVEDYWRLRVSSIVHFSNRKVFERNRRKYERNNFKN